MIGHSAVSANCPAGALNNMTGFVFYGDIKAIGKKGIVGAIVGADRSEKITIKNAQLGGNFIFSTETGTDAAGNDEVWDVKTPIDLTMIYKTAITVEQAEADGCSIITEKPAVPTVPAQ